jgi:NAD+ synthase (glutamine-hydrolysing)
MPGIDGEERDADPRPVRFAIAQLNPTVGDLTGNRRLVEDAAARAEAAGAELVVFSEMVLTGYPPMDLLERDGFVRDQLAELEQLAPLSRGIDIALGVVLPVEESRSKRLANAAVLLRGGERVAVQSKSLLPTYDVFDEKRYFLPTQRREPIAARDGSLLFGLTICEDAWGEEIPYRADPVADLVEAGASLVLNLSASPWHVGKPVERRRILAALATRHRVPFVFTNQVGGNDELIFDGASFVVDAEGKVRASLPLFEPALEIVDLRDGEPGQDPEEVAEPERIAQLEAGLVLGIRDYFRKQGLPPGAVVGLSGGIDSAVTAHLAVEALGSDRVVGIAMPGPFSSEHSVDDALALGKNLGIEIRTVELGPIYDAFLNVFAELFGKRSDYGVAQQNIQSRIRGSLLMAVSNAEGRLVLATGNKSELSVGYCTLYGDTVGGLAVLGDVYKRDVYALAHHANKNGERIPTNSISKPPSAELAPDQLDSDDLPPYEVLDEVLIQAIEGGLGAASIRPPEGTSPEVARDIVRRLDRNEYKRRQAPLVLRVSRKAFGSGRRLPIVHRYHGENG